MQAPTGSSSQTGEPAFNAEWGPPDAITDPDLLQMNVYAVMMLKGSFGDVEPLDPRELMKSEGATIPLIEVRIYKKSAWVFQIRKSSDPRKS